MAVLVEAISVIVRKDAIIREFSENWDEFVTFVPNNTLCADDEIARVGFMTPTDVENFVLKLEANGIKFLEKEQALEIAVVDQFNGIISECNWLEFGRIKLEGKYNIAACRLVGSKIMTVLTPDEWKYENSLSQNPGYVLPDRQNRSFKFLRHENGIDVYLNLVTQEEVFVGRTE